jgi:hypothetical protein
MKDGNYLLQMRAGRGKTTSQIAPFIQFVFRSCRGHWLTGFGWFLQTFRERVSTATSEVQDGPRHHHKAISPLSK